MQLISKISIGDVVRLINGNLYIYTQRQVLNLPVCQLTEINLRVMKKALTLSEQEIQGVFESLDFENNWGLSTNHPAQLMQRFLQAQSEEEVEKVVYYLMGRGKGLTPSGDDMLVGLMTTLGTFRPNAQSTWRMVINHRMAEQVTTNVSQAYLAASVDGFASKKLLDLMQALHMGDAREINLAVIAMKNFGHTSGMDTLFGIFCGLKLALLS
ncbi:hypothetical protein VC81_06810 [Levilactobacillus spicheri]|uniref:DUF2877 domain-containing protein n=2 Tax=Levilactobacillus spicheri TaxID=216463 RepID=A0A0F3RVK7_9LACO|nr:hypothetical protein VC81_06810 [Levilactobacillus spicheri]